MSLPVKETLATMREEVKARLGFGGSGTAFTSNNTLIDSWLRECQEMLYLDHDFSELDIRDETTQCQTGQGGYDWPDDIDPIKISAIECRDDTITSGNVFPMYEGITRAQYGLIGSGDYDRPRRYKRASNLQVWPYPDSNDYTIIISGYQRLGAFTSETDRATVPELHTKLLAIAKGKKHYRHPDAQDYDLYYAAYLKKLRSGDAGLERHVRPSGDARRPQGSQMIHRHIDDV